MRIGGEGLCGGASLPLAWIIAAASSQASRPSSLAPNSLSSVLGASRILKHASAHGTICCTHSRSPATQSRGRCTPVALLSPLQLSTLASLLAPTLTYTLGLRPCICCSLFLVWISVWSSSLCPSWLCTTSCALPSPGHLL